MHTWTLQRPWARTKIRYVISFLVPRTQPSDALILSRNDMQLYDSGPVLDGVGAEPEGTPSPIPIPPTSSSSHLVPNGFFPLLAAVFGITLMPA
jgi:hypothetical protein